MFQSTRPTMARQKRTVRLVILHLIVSLSVAPALDHVIDTSNLAENIRTATAQLESLQVQCQQLQRMLLDAMNPGSFNFGSLQGILSSLQGNLFNINLACQQAGGIQQALDQYKDVRGYETMTYGTDDPALFRGAYEGSTLEKQAADALLKLIKEQQEQLKDFSDSVESLKSKAASAQGQQEAIQAGNEFASKQLELLGMIHAVLLEQNQLLGAKAETEVDERARKRRGSAIVMGKDGHLEQLLGIDLNGY